MASAIGVRSAAEFARVFERIVRHAAVRVNVPEQTIKAIIASIHEELWNWAFATPRKPDAVQTARSETNG